MKFHDNVWGEVRVNFLALFASKPHIFKCGALKLSGIVRANVRLNIAIPMLCLSLVFKASFYPPLNLCFVGHLEPRFGNHGLETLGPPPPPT